MCCLKNSNPVIVCEHTGDMMFELIFPSTCQHTTGRCGEQSRLLRLQKPSTRVPTTNLRHERSAYDVSSVYSSCPPMYVSCLSAYVSCHSVYVSCPLVYVNCPSVFVSCPSVYVSCPSVYVSCPSVYATYS